METAIKTGKFIVLDGIDGCGKGTQTKLLSDFLTKKGYNILIRKYPDYDHPIGQLIHEFLYKKFNPNLGTEVLLYTAGHIKDNELINGHLEKNGIVLSDRYFTSTIVYQYLKGFPLEKIIALTEMFEAPKPDLCVLIKISPETSLNRKSKEKSGNLDRHEEDKQFQTKLAETFQKMVDENIYCEWAVVDGEQSPESVHQQIIEVLNKKLNI
jgi:dTMP kinase